MFNFKLVLEVLAVYYGVGVTSTSHTYHRDDVRLTISQDKVWGKVFRTVYRFRGVSGPLEEGIINHLEFATPYGFKTAKYVEGRYGCVVHTKLGNLIK